MFTRHTCRTDILFFIVFHLQDLFQHLPNDFILYVLLSVLKDISELGCGAW